MPDFRHAHTLQQSEIRTTDSLSVRAFCFDDCFLDLFLLFVFLDFCFLIVSIFCFIFIVETRGGTRNESTDCCSVWA